MRDFFSNSSQLLWNSLLSTHTYDRFFGFQIYREITLNYEFVRLLTLPWFERGKTQCYDLGPSRVC